VTTPTRKNRWAAVLLQPRWVALTFFVVLFVPLAVYLGFWQFDRGDERDDFNQDLLSQLTSPPRAIDDSVDLDSLATWAPIVVSGQFDTATDILVRRRTQGGYSGYYVLTPFRIDEQTSVLVNRGWLRAVGAASINPAVPPAPTGTLELKARWRPAETTQGPVPTDLPAYQIVAIDPSQIADTYPEVGSVISEGYLQSEIAQQVEGVLSTDSAGSGVTPLQPINLPTLSSGPHLGYAIQWLIFGSIAIVGWVILLKREVRPK
jgi:cytochrome oxidase assembly protein ShyY1